MKTEWNREPHTTVRWAIFEALRGADNASTVDYWDVVTENLIQGLGLRTEWSYEHNGVVYTSVNGELWVREYVKKIQQDYAKYGNPTEVHVVHRLVSDWKREDSND